MLVIPDTWSVAHVQIEAESVLCRMWILVCILTIYDLWLLHSQACGWWEDCIHSTIQVLKWHSNVKLPLNWQQHSTLQLLLTHVVHAVQAIVRFSSLQETDVITFSSLVSSLFLYSADTFFQGITISCVSLFYWWLELYSCDSQVKDFQLPSLVSQLTLNQFKSIESAKVHHLNSSHWWSDLSRHHSLKISPFISVISCVPNLDLTLLLRYKLLWVWVHLPLGI